MLIFTFLRDSRINFGLCGGLVIDLRQSSLRNFGALNFTY